MTTFAPSIFTRPLDGKVAGTSTNCTADLNNIYDTVGQVVQVNVLDAQWAGGADPTGTNDCHAAFAAAFAGLPATGGIIHIPAGTYKLATSWVMSCADGQPVRIVGDGIVSTMISYRGSGSALQMYDASGNAANVGSGIEGLTIDGTTSSANSIGLTVGDLIYLHLDLQVQNFLGTGTAVGVLFQNNHVWTEQMTARLRVSHCDTLVQFSVNTGYKSFGYSDFELTCYADPGQTAVWVSTGAYFYNSSMRIRGNFGTSGSAMTSSVILVSGVAPGGSPDSGKGSALYCSHLDVQVESDGGLANAPTTIVAPSNLCAGNYGILSFGFSFGGFSSASAGTLNNFSFAGMIIGDNVLNAGGSGDLSWKNTLNGDATAYGSAVTGGTGTGDQNITGCALNTAYPNSGQSAKYAVEAEIFYTPSGTVGSTNTFGIVASSGAISAINLTGYAQEAGVSSVSTAVTTASRLTTPTHTTGSGFMLIRGTITTTAGALVQLVFANITSADTVNILANAKLMLKPLTQ